MIKLFITDLDGTLIQHGEDGMSILPEDIKAIETLVNHNVAFGIATGRVDIDIVAVLKQIKQSGHRISQNGAFVYDQNDNFVNGVTFSKQLSERLHTAIESNTSNYFVTTADAVHVPFKSEAVKQLEELSYFPITESPNLQEQFGASIKPSKFSLYGETEAIVYLKELLAKDFAAETESYLSDKHCVDFLPKGISKALGLTHLIKKLDLQPEEVAVIGDSYNDISMLQMTPHSYAIATADTEVQNHATKVVNHVHEAIEDLQRRDLLSSGLKQ